jgi:hypothetical protein
MILNGELCESCAGYIDNDEPGYPRKCSSCKPSKKRNKKPKSKTNKGKGAV